MTRVIRTQGLRKFGGKKMAVLLFFVLLSLCVGFLSSRMSRFRFSEVRVSSTSDSAELATRIKRVLVGDFGKSLFSLSLRDVEQKILKISEVKSVRLHRRWPSVLQVEVVVKRPVAIGFLEGKLWTIADSGMRIESVKIPAPLPLIIGFENFERVRTAPHEPGVPSEIFSFMREASVYESPEGLEWNKISELRWTEGRGLVLWSYEYGMEIDLGFERFFKSWVMADQAIRWANTNDIALSQIDASYAWRVVARPRSKLQNSQIGLNLEELVRRKDSGAAAAR